MRLVYRFLAALGFLVMLVTVTPVLRLWIAALSSPWGPDQGEVLVIPGAEMLAPDTLGVSSYWRSFYGSVVWRQAHFQKVIVSGKDAAPIMADFLAGHGVPRDAIVLENEAESTHENAVNVAKLLGPKPGRVILLTSEYHSGRALHTFRQAGVNCTALPYPDAYERMELWKDRWSVFLMLAEETVKIVWYRAHGW